MRAFLRSRWSISGYTLLLTAGAAAAVAQYTTSYPPQGGQLYLSDCGG